MFFGHTKSEYSLLNFENPWRKARKFAPPPLYSVQYVHGVNIKIQYQKNDVENCVNPA